MVFQFRSHSRPDSIFYCTVICFNNFCYSKTFFFKEYFITEILNVLFSNLKKFNFENLNFAKTYILWSEILFFILKILRSIVSEWGSKSYKQGVILHKKPFTKWRWAVNNGQAKILSLLMSGLHSYGTPTLHLITLLMLVEKKVGSSHSTAIITFAVANYWKWMW